MFNHKTQYIFIIIILFLLQEDYDRLRVISYMNCDVFLVCFAIDDTNSLKSVETNWVPELRRYLPKTPFILVGTRADRRDDNTGNKVGLNLLEASNV